MTQRLFLKTGMISGILFIPLIFLGCATGNCRQNSESQKAACEGKNSGSATCASLAEKKPETKSTTMDSTVDRVRVYKYDGSLQCGQGKTIKEEVMQKEFGEIPVYSATNKSDGLMHIMACGTPTGKANVYEIDRKNLQEALKKGFKEWTFE